MSEPCAGGSATVSVGSTSKVLGLGSRDVVPGLYLVSLSYRRPERLSGSMTVVATISWGTGKGSAQAVLDLPAGGTAVSVAANDSLDVTVTAEGTDAETTVRVEAQVVRVHASHPRPAQRTTRVELGARASIPSFARAARVLAPAELEAAKLRLVQYTSAADEAEALSSVALAGVATSPLPVVAGAEVFALEASASLSSSVRIPIVWELSL